MSITRDEIIRILLRTEGTEDAAKLRSELGRLVDTTDTAARRNQSFAAALDQSKVALVASAAAVYGLVQAFSGAAKASSDLQTAIAAIGTIAEGADLDALTAQVQALSREFGGTAATQAKALYEIIAAGVSDSTQAMEVLSTANKLAIGGLADVETAASGLVATLNSYGLAADQATRVSDAFFVAAAAGNATIEELASTIGSVAPLAASTGVSIEELAASVGALTAGGLTTSQAMTQVQSMLTAVVKPTAQAAKAAEELGVNFSTAEIRAKGFTTWLQEVSAAAGGNETVLAQLFGRVEGLQGVLALTGNQAEAFTAALSSMTESAGATERAFERLSDTPAQRMERFRASVDGLKVAIGNVVTALAPVLDAVAAVINAFTELPQAIQTTIIAVGSLGAALLAMTAAARAAAPAMRALMAVLGAQGLGGAFVFATTSTGKLAAALRLARLAASGFIVVAGSLLLYETWSGWILGASQAADAQRDLAAATGNLETQIEKVKLAYGGLAELQIRSNEQVAQLSEYNLSAYVSQLDAAAKYWRAIEVEAKRAGDEQTRAMAKERAQEYSAALDQARGRMAALGEAAKETAEDIESALVKAFKDLGLESQASLQGAATKAADALKVITEAARQGKAAQEDVRRAFESWAEAARKAAADSDAAGKAAVEAQIRAQQSALETAGVLKEVAQAPKAAAEAVREVGAGLIDVEKSANTADKAIAAMTDNSKGAAEALAGVLNGMRDSLRQYGDAAVAEFDKIFESIASVDRRWQTAGMTLTQILGKVAGVANAVAERHKIAQEAAERHARSMAYLSEHADEAAAALARQGKSLDDLRSGAISAHDALLALGNQRMHKLRPELEGVASALEGIDQKASDAVAALADLNREYEKARLQRLGNDSAIEELRHQDELRRIQELADAAGLAGAAEAAEARRRAEAEHQARMREIREREREEKRAANEVARERESSGAGSGSGGGSGGDRGSGGGNRREVDRVIRVEIPDVGNVDVVDEDSARALERGLEAVARAARAGRRTG